MTPSPSPSPGPMTREEFDRADSAATFCQDCQKTLAEHAKCEGCGHYECDCICEFLRDVWPTHPANPEAAR